MADIYTCNQGTKSVKIREWEIFSEMNGLREMLTKSYKEKCRWPFNDMFSILFILCVLNMENTPIKIITKPKTSD